MVINGERHRLEHAREEPSPLLQIIGDLRSEIEARLSNDELTRLLRTLTPCFEAYQCKAAIAIAEEMAAEAAPWMLRDVEFLMARLDPPAP